jgi:shikimate kinase
MLREVSIFFTLFIKIPALYVLYSLRIYFAKVIFGLKALFIRVLDSRSLDTISWKDAAMNITLIGMAGAGKSTIGKALSKRLSYTFIDVDRLITESAGVPLQVLIDKEGDSSLIRFEEESILRLGLVEGCIISPGGSVVYSEKSMGHLKNISKIVFLDAPFRSIVKRIPNARKRGIVGLRDRSLKELFEERRILYLKYADFSIKIKGRESIQELVEKIIELCFEEKN